MERWAVWKAPRNSKLLQRRKQIKAKGVLLAVTEIDAMVLPHSAGETEHGG